MFEFYSGYFHTKCSLSLSLECSKCAFNRNNGDMGGLPTYDLIRQFHLSESEEQYNLITGSIQSQQAYQLRRESNLSTYTSEAFPYGIPQNFWIESTFRVRLQSSQPWYLLHVTNFHEVTQISVIMDSVQQLIGIGLPDIKGNVQRVFFQNSNLFDDSWHKILISVNLDQVQLWVDCQQILSRRGELSEQLLPRKKFDIYGGHTYISQSVAESIDHGQVTI